jgi:hypothetical protein
MIIYLYHKRHKITGLNYFGKTIKNPLTYNGSGIYWTKHLKKYGKHIETVQVWEFTNLSECNVFAINFSNENNIVISKSWANLKVEDGLMGGDTLSQLPKERLDEIKRNRSITHKEIWETRDRVTQASAIANIWKSRSIEEKDSIFEKISNTLKNKSASERESTHEKYLATVSNRKIITCSHCSKTGTSVANMNRYHFDHCTKNPSALPRKSIPIVICEYCHKHSDPGNHAKYHGNKCKFKII